MESRGERREMDGMVVRKSNTVGSRPEGKAVRSMSESRNGWKSRVRARVPRAARPPNDSHALSRPTSRSSVHFSRRIAGTAGMAEREAKRGHGACVVVPRTRAYLGHQLMTLCTPLYAHHAEPVEVFIQVMWAAVALACTRTLASSFSSFGKEAAKETAATLKDAALESAQVVAAPLNAAVVILEKCVAATEADGGRPSGVRSVGEVRHACEAPTS